MANAGRVHAIESGKELTSRTLVAFGGAAPLHVARVAEKLGIRRILIPAAAGVGSCVGFLKAPVAFEIVRSFYQHLASFNLGAVNEVLQEIRDQAAAEVRAAAPGTALVEKRLAYMRYAGQGSEVVVPLPEGDLPDDAAALLLRAFEEIYAAQYTHKIPNAGVEVVSWSVTVSAPAVAAPAAPAEATPHEAEPESRRQIVDPQTGATIDLDVYSRQRLAPGARLDGPAVVVEDQTSSLIPAGFSATVDAFGHLEITRT